MPVEAGTSEFTYLGDGVTKTFPFPSRFFSNDDLSVGVNNVEQDPSTYTVTGAGSATGGSVIFNAAPAVGAGVLLLRKPEASQLVDFVNGQTILEGTLDTALDKLTMVIQYILREIQKCVRVSEFDPSMISALPFAEVRANQLLGFDVNGNPAAAGDYASISTGAATATAAAAAAQAAQTAATAASAAASASAASAQTFNPSNYVTTTALTTTLASYVTTTALTTTLASYVTTTALTTTLASYVPTSRKLSVSDALMIGGTAGGNADLSADRSLDLSFASTAVVAAGTDTAKPVNSAGVAAAIAALVPAPAISKSYESAEITIVFGGTFSLTHGLGSVPKIMDICLVCKTAEGGYTVGDEFWQGGAYTSASNAPGVALSRTATTITGIMYTMSSMYIMRKDTTTAFTATPANWRLKVRAFA